jgi:hypothetical protein
MTPPRSMSPARALDQHDVGLSAQPLEAVKHMAHQFALDVLVAGGVGIGEHLTLHHDLCADVALRLQEHRVHVDAGRHAGRQRLKRLGAADLAAILGDGGVVRHVLRLERPHLQPAADERARQPGDDQRLADVGAGALEHQRPRGHQNSTPACAFTPAAK